VDVAEKQMPDAGAVGFDNRDQSRRIGERDAVHHMHAHGKRRLVHEQIDRPIGRGLGQRLPQPGEAPIAELSVVAGFVERVEKQEAVDRVSRQPCTKPLVSRGAAASTSRQGARRSWLPTRTV
jgi:hypothetical protein